MPLTCTQNPGVAPPDCALLFCWPKRVIRKGPALRWACLVRKDGNFNVDHSNRSKVYTSPAGPEALEVLSRSGRSCPQLIFTYPLIKAIT